MEQILNSRYVIILGRREYTQRKVKKNPSFGAREYRVRAVCAAASDRKGTKRASRVRVRRSEDANSCCVVLPGRGQMVNPHVKTAAPLSSAVRCPPTRRRDPFFNHSPVAFSVCCCLLGSVWSLDRSLAMKLSQMYKGLAVKYCNFLFVFNNYYPTID